MDRAGVPNSGSAAVEDCAEGCCLVALPDAPAPIPSDKLKLDSVALDAASAAANPIADAPPERTVRPVDANGRIQDLSVLLHTFRI